MGAWICYEVFRGVSTRCGYEAFPLPWLPRRGYGSSRGLLAASAKLHYHNVYDVAQSSWDWGMGFWGESSALWPLAASICKEGSNGLG